jgi:hypothetical protein
MFYCLLVYRKRFMLRIDRNNVIYIIIKIYATKNDFFLIRDEMFAVFENGTTKATVSSFCEFLTISSDLLLFRPYGSMVSNVSIQNVSLSNQLFCFLLQCLLLELFQLGSNKNFLYYFRHI